MSRLAWLIATGFGAGYSPVASGTAGSLLVLPLLPALARFRDASPVGYAVLVAAAVAVAFWAADRASRDFQTIDDGRIVIDEVVGMMLAGAFLPGTWRAALIVFVAFRIFDVWKPMPIRQLEKRLPGGFGVVADDLLAGVYAGVAVRLLLPLT